MLSQSIKRNSISAAAMLLACAAPSTFAGLPPTTIGLNPKATYLHVAAADSALASPAIDLAALGYSPGDFVRLERLGLFDNGPQGKTFGSLLGVFSSTNVLLASASAHRVPGAIEAGSDFNSACTFFGCEPTNIPEDFAIGAPDLSFTSVCMTIPAGAAFLFVGPHDSLYEDNTDPNGDYALRITLIPCPADVASPANGTVNIDDLFTVIAAWGACPAPPEPCSADIDCNGQVNIDDLFIVIAAWGPCPP